VARLWHADRPRHAGAWSRVLHARSVALAVKQMFGDDEHVCVVGKVTAVSFLGSQHLQGAERPYSTYECIVYRIADGKMAESTAYIDWLDPYVQVGLVDVGTLTR
jgi:hypothetical protein